MHRTTWRILLSLLTLSAMAVGATGAWARDDTSAGGHGARATARLFTLSPDPAANPEGIAYDQRRNAFYVSDTGSGRIYRGTLGSDTVSPFITQVTAKAAVGLEVRRGKLYVAGGPTGTIAVYDLRTKAPVATFETGSGGFLNDLVVTESGDVYVTDSFRPTLWHVTAAQVAAGGGTAQALDVSGGIQFGDGFNLNGIVAKGRRTLTVVQSNTGKLFQVRLANGGAAIRSITEVAGVSLPGGDGMIFDRGRLVVVQGGPPAQLTFVKLKHGGTRGRIVGSLRSDLLNGPSTVARAKRLYLVVNADFAASATPFTVAGLRARGGHRHGHGDDGRADDHGGRRSDGN